MNWSEPGTPKIEKRLKTPWIECILSKCLQECITAGHYQNLHPNVTKKASSGKHGSKFVTVVVTGDKDNLVHMEGYQVSNQCMALVRENVLLPTRDAPELGYVKESGQKQYVPDVFYKVSFLASNQILEGLLDRSKIIDLPGGPINDCFGNILLLRS